MKISFILYLQERGWQVVWNECYYFTFLNWGYKFYQKTDWKVEALVGWLVGVSEWGCLKYEWIRRIYEARNFIDIACQENILNQNKTATYYLAGRRRGLW